MSAAKAGQGRRGMRKSTRVAVLVIILGVVAALAAYRLSGRSFGLSRYLSTARAIIDSSNVAKANQHDFTDVVFLHHSVGYNLIQQGGIRESLTKAGFSLWDHGFNWEGVNRPDGRPAGYSYNIPDDNTDPPGLARLFAQPAYGLPLNAFSALLQHDVIVFKSCFTIDNIASEDQLQQFKSYYLDMRQVMDRHPDKLFIVVTPPPMNPAETSAEAAARVRDFADWLKSDSYLAGHPNIVTFDLFGQLAEAQPAAPDYNMLAAGYRDGADSHPNRAANEKIGPVFVDFITAAARNYRLALSSRPS